MEFQGRVKKILPLRSGVSQRTGNEWKSLPFIFEFFEHDTDHYSQTVVLETFDTKVIDNLKEGMEVRCGFEHRTREYDGKFYNEMRLYKIESVKGAQQAPQGANASAAGNQPTPPFPQPQNPSNQADDDDLPF
jgi:hypothetical protein